MVYKLRAETSYDVMKFIQKAQKHLRSFKMNSPDIRFPDVNFEFDTNLSLNEIIHILKKIPDSHVMYETVKPIDKYTGRRVDLLENGGFINWLNEEF